MHTWSIQVNLPEQKEVELGERGPRKAMEIIQNGTSLMVKTPPSNAGDMYLIPDMGTKTPHATGCGPQKSYFKMEIIQHIQ